MKTILMVLALMLSQTAWAGRAEDNKALMDAAFANQQKLAEIDARMLTDKATAEGEAKRAQAEAMGQKAAAAMNACAKDPNPLACVAVVQSLTSAEAMMAQMADAMKAMAAADSLPQRQAIPIPYRRDMGAIVKDMASPFTPLMGQVVGGMERVRLAEIGLDRDNAQFQAFTGIANTAIAANAQVSGAAVANAQPSYNVSGVLVQGNQHNGNNVNGNHNALEGSETNDADTDVQLAGNNNALGQSQASDDDTQTQVEVSGALVIESTDTQIEQDEGDQRIESPGPIDQSDNGDCDGDGGCDNGGGAP